MTTTPRRVRSQDTRKKIFDAAATLLKKHGEDYLTIANICEQAGISKGTFFYHFNSKDDLMLYYLQEGFDSFVISRNHITQAGSDIYKLVSLLYEDYLEYCKDAGIEFITNYYTPKNKALDARSSMGTPDTMNMLMRACLEGFSKAQQEGYIRSDWQAIDMAFDCCSLAKGCVFEWCLTNGTIDVNAHMQHILAIYFNSIVTDKYRKEFPHEEPPCA